MKKQLLFLLFCISISLSGWSQEGNTYSSYSVNPVVQTGNSTAGFIDTAFAKIDL